MCQNVPKKREWHHEDAIASTGLEFKHYKEVIENRAIYYGDIADRNIMLEVARDGIIIRLVDSPVESLKQDGMYVENEGVSKRAIQKAVEVLTTLEDVGE